MSETPENQIEQTNESMSFVHKQKQEIYPSDLNPKIESKLQLARHSNRSKGKVNVTALGSAYTVVSGNKSAEIDEVDRISKFYIVDTIVSTLAEDAFDAGSDDSQMVEISSEDEAVQEEIDRLCSRISFSNLVSTIVPELIKYGDYCLKTEFYEDEDGTRTRGISSLLDSVNQKNIVPISDWSEVVGYIYRHTQGGQATFHNPSEFVCFSVSSMKRRISIYGDYFLGKEDEKLTLPNGREIPPYIRVGRSIIYPIIPKLKELELLEALIPATKISKLSSGNLVGVRVPANMDLDAASALAERAEQIINSKKGVDTSQGDITLTNILSAAGNTKVVPVFGDTGELQKQDYKSDEIDSTQSEVKEIRETICSAIGIPPEILFGGEDDRRTTLRRYARYLRKLKAIRAAVKKGIMQVVMIHFANREGFEKIQESDVNIKFMKRLIDTDSLDELEFVDATTSLLENAKDFVFRMANPEENPYFADEINIDSFKQFLSAQFSTVGLYNLIKEKEEPTKPTFMDSPSRPRREF